MRVYGLDFTSAPDAANSEAQKKKRLMLAVCKLEKDVLYLEEMCLLNRTAGSFSGFEEWLGGSGAFEARENKWIAGIDFPFGQPAKLVSELKWPDTWSGYVQHVKRMRKGAFEKELERFKQRKPDGEKHLFREIDRLTHSQSPMTLSGTPVGKMFYEGAYRLCDADVCVVPVRPKESTRVVVEAYPALVARKWIGLKQGYKKDDPTKDDECKKYARCDIVSAIRGKDKNNCRKSLKEWYGFTVEMTDECAKDCVDDFTGDTLDSVLSAVQAAWASRHGSNYGVPANVNLLEGWICDPETAKNED